jgi:DNA-binding transcriptional LysR family regulator
MDTNRLRYFLVVCETGSVRKAADLLHVSPAALSKAIKILELISKMPVDVRV